MERLVPGDPNVEPHFLHKIELEHLNRYRFAAGFVRGKRVIDVGCGVGYGSALLADEGAAHVAAFDKSAPAVETAGGRFARDKVSYSVHDASVLPQPDASVDVVVALEVIEHVEDPRAVMREIRRVLAEAGILVISTPRFNGTLRSDYHLREYSHQEFTELLGASFEHVALYLQNPGFANLIQPAQEELQPGRVRPLESWVRPEEESDTFLAVASDSELELAKGSLLALQDDSYIRYLEQERTILKEDWEAKEKKLADLAAELASRGQELTQLRAELATEREAVGELEREAAERRRRASDERERLRAALESQGRQVAELETALQSLQAELSVLESSSERRARLADRLASRYRRSRGELVEARRQAVEKERLWKEAADRVERSEGRVAELQDSLEAEFSNSKRLLREKERDYDELKQRYYEDLAAVGADIGRLLSPLG